MVSRRKVNFPIKKVLFVLPSLPLTLKTGRGFTHIKEVPLGLLSLSRELEKSGISTEILDLHSNELPAGTLEERIREFGPGLVGVSATISTLAESAEAIKTAKRLGCLAVVGGRIVSMISLSELSDLGADAAVFGLGAEPLVAMCKSRNWRRIPQVLVQGDSKKPKNLLGKTRPRYLPGQPPTSRSLTNKSFAATIASIGCPYSCKFCSEFIETNRVWRAYDPKKVVEELGRLADAGVKGVFFNDSIFGFEKSWLREFCKLMIETGTAKRIWWQCFERVDGVDDGILALMKRAGCNMIFFGVESGSNRVLRLMNKGITVAQTRKAFSATRRAGIFTYASIMLGYPGETLEDIALTKKLILEIDPDFFHINYFGPFPKTEAAKKAPVIFGIIDLYSENPRKYKNCLDFRQLIAAKKDIFRAFYTRPSRIIKMFIQSKGNPRTLFWIMSPLFYAFTKGPGLPAASQRMDNPKRQVY